MNKNYDSIAALNVMLTGIRMLLASVQAAKKDERLRSIDIKLMTAEIRAATAKLKKEAEKD